MFLPRRLLIALISAGWLVPMSIAWFAVVDFQQRVLLGVVVHGDDHVLTPFHLAQYADRLYAIAAVWAASVIVGWSFYLTSPSRRS